MTVQHKSLRDEILFILGRASEPLDSGQIYERCTLAEEVKRVSDALWILRTDGKIAFAEGDGRKRYVLASGVAAPAPAGKAGRQAVTPAEPGLPKIDIPTLGDPGISLNGAAGKTKADKPKADKFAPARSTPPDTHPAGGLGAASAGKLIQVVDIDASAARLADAMLAKSRQQLAPGLEGGPLWWIDQDGCLEISDRGDNGLLVEFSREQARLMAAMVMAVHDEMGHS